MPRIPPYQRTVQAQGTSGGLMNPNAPAGAFGAGLGQGIQQAAATMDQVQHQADVMRVEGAANQLRQKQQELQGKLQGLRGEQALNPEAFGGQQGQGLDQVAGRWFDDAAQEVSQSLSTDRQKAMFSQASGRFRLEFGAHVQSHVNRETEVVAKDTYTGAQAVEDQNISQNGVGPDGRVQGASITQSIGRKVHAAEQLSAFLGESGDSRQARVLAAQSGGHALVLDELLKKNNTQGAQVYFDTNRAQMDPKVTAAMEGRIGTAVLANSVQAQADRIQGLGLPLDQQDAAAREAFKGNAEGMKLLQGELEHRFNVQKTARVVAQQETTGKLWDMRFPTLPGQKAQGMTQIMRTPEWNALNGEQRNELRDQWDAHTKRSASGADSDPAIQVERHLAYYNLVNDPGFATLTENQIRATQGKLGSQLTIQVMADLQKLRTNPGKVKEVQIDNDLLQAAAREYGLVKGNKPNDAEKSQIGALSAEMKMIQQSSGKEWNYQDTKKLAKELAAKVVIERGWFRNTAKPFFELQRDIAIPKAFVDRITTESAAAGKPTPTNSRLYQLWFDAKDKGLVDENGNVK